MRTNFRGFIVDIFKLIFCVITTDTYSNYAEKTNLMGRTPLIFSIVSTIPIILLIQISFASQDIVGEQDTTSAQSYLKLAEAASEADQFHLAIDRYHRAYSVLRDTDDFITVTELYNGMSTAFAKLGISDSAFTYLKKAAIIYENNSAFSHPVIAKTFSRLGKYYLREGIIDSAIVNFERSAAIYRDYWDFNDPDITPIYDTLNRNDYVNIRLGRLYKSMGIVSYMESDRSSSIQYLKNAADIFLDRLHSQHILLGATYRNLGMYYHYMDNVDYAIVYLEKASVIFEEYYGTNSRQVISMYADLGHVHRNAGIMGRARHYYSIALSLLVNIDDPSLKSVGSLYNNIGVTYFYDGYLDSAIVYYKKGIDQYRIAGDGTYDWTGRTLRNISHVFSQRGMIDSSIVYLGRSLDIIIENYGEEDAKVGELYSLIGFYKSTGGDHSAGLQYQHRALSILEHSNADNHNTLAAVYSHIGIINRRLENYSEALFYYQKALETREKTTPSQDAESLGNIYMNMGETYRAMERYDDAISSYTYAIEQYLETYEHDHTKLASAYSNIGKTYMETNNAGLAEQYFNGAIRILREAQGDKHPRLTTVYKNLGDLYRNKNDTHNALSYYQKAIIASVPDFSDTSIYANPHNLYAHGPQILITVLQNKARSLRTLYRLRGDFQYFTAAHDTYKAAAVLIQSLRTNINTEESRLAITDNSHTLHEEGVETAFELYALTNNPQYLQDAFALSEMNKSAVLWQSMIETDTHSFTGIPDSLRDAETILRRDIAFVENELLKYEPESNRYGQLSETYYTKSTQYDLLRTRFKNDYPEYYEITQRHNIPSPQQIQEILDEGEAYLQYFTGDSALYIFVITDALYFVHRIQNADSFSSDVHSYTRSIRRADRSSFFTHSSKLYDTLIRPVRSLIEDATRLIIVPDGMLFYVPFEALIDGQTLDRTAQTNFSAANYLIKDFEIVYHYSMRLFISNRRNSGKHSSGSPTFAGFAPVFQTRNVSNMILGTLSGTNDYPFHSDDRYRSLLTEDMRFVPLPYSQIEIENIIDLCRSKEIDAVGFLFDAASEANFKRYAGDYSIVHIASHGIIHEQNPKLSGIVFSQNQTDIDREDGILFSGELHNLSLNADLVVLSSCDSGIGELVRGEGLISMTRGFMFSGASNIVVSLWKVSDQYTSVLMNGFYRNVLNDKTYSRALREAKLGMLLNESTALPLFWSSFVLIGT
jgi:CHAT domain-containing protein